MSITVTRVLQATTVTPPPVNGNWETRKTGRGVVRYWDFDSLGQLNSGIDENVLSSPNDYGTLFPVLDTSMKLSGNSSMRIDIPSNSTSNSGGSWNANFSTDLQTRFGANSEFYYQVRMRWSASLLNTVFYIDQFDSTLYTATYISATSFSISGNVTSLFTVHLGCRVRKGSGIPLGHGIITSSTYDGTKTTIVLNVNQGTLTGIVSAQFSSGGPARAMTPLASAPTYVNATTITFPANETPTLRGVRWAVRARDSADNIIGYGIITSLTFAAGVTTCVLRMTQGTLTGIAGADACAIQGGKKFFDVYAGDSYGPPPVDGFGIHKFFSSDNTKVVVQGHDQHPDPIIYRIYDGGTKNLQPSNGAGDIYLQNAIDNNPSTPRYCLFSQTNTVNAEVATPGCWAMPADEWVTFQLGITLGDLNPSYVDPTTGDVLNVWDNSRVRLWAARYGQPSVLLIDWNTTVNGYRPLSAGPVADQAKFGKTTLFPYLTDKDAMQVHPACSAWYDEIIISTLKIPDPIVSPLSDLPSGQLRDLGRYANLTNPNIVFPDNISDDSGVIFNPATGKLHIFGGGHGGGMETDIRTLDLLATPPTWSSEYTSTPYNSVAMAPGNCDILHGRWSATGVTLPVQPTARHSYNMQVVRNDQLWMMQGQGMPRPYNGSFQDTSLWGGHPWSYNFTTQQFFYSQYGRFGDSDGAPNTPWYTESSAYYDSQSDKILVCGGQYSGNNLLHIWMYDPVTDVITQLLSTSIDLSQGGDLIYVPASNLYYIVQPRVDASGSGRVWTFNFNPTTFVISNFQQLSVSGAPSQDYKTMPNSLGRAPNALQYDPVNNIIGGYISYGKFNAFHLNNNTWTTHQILTETSLTPSTVTQAVQCLDYDTNSGCFIFLSSPAPEGNAHTWAFRYNPAG